MCISGKPSLPKWKLVGTFHSIPEIILFFFFLSDLQNTHSYPVNEVWYVHNLPGYGYKLRAWQFLILDLNVACI